jgi:hypothetical protein
MQIIKLIKQLQSLYATYDDEYKSVMGEPEIVIDVFEKIGDTHQFEYVGYSPDIIIEKTDCGTYDILSAFYENPKTETEKPASALWPFPPECGET